MNKKQSICILFGGKSEEYEVSLLSSFNVLKNIDYDKYEVHKIGITSDGKWLRYFGSDEKILKNTWQNDNDTSDVLIDFSTGSVDKLPIDTVFIPIMHGTFCEDGRLQGIFETLGAKYIGCNAHSSFLCMDKHLTKLVAQSIGVPVVPSLCVNKNSFDFEKVRKEVLNFMYPVFIKPTKSGSSRGSGVVYSENSLLGALMCAFEFSDSVLIERFVKCTECEIGVLSTHSITIFSPVGSISYGGEFYDYNEKYINNKTVYNIPATVSYEVQRKITKYSKDLFSRLGCYGLSRLDFFVDENEKIYFNEINTFPGFTKESMFPMLFEKIGYTFKDIIDILIENAKI